MSDVKARCDTLALQWGVALDRWFETPTSLIAHGRRDEQPVVLKVVKFPGDEWRSGQVLRAFDERGVVRVYEHADGALLLERLDPGESLARLTLTGRDEEATTILANVIGAMSPPSAVRESPTVQEWGAAFGRYVESRDDQVPIQLVSQADRLYAELCQSQREPRLLHGDLQHDNVLYDRHRGWLAIDPKGVVGEIEYEIGAALRNPCERPDIFTNSATIARRLTHFSSALQLDFGRMLAWGFAQAVLSAIWDVEDGSRVDAGHPSLSLAIAMRPMLENGD